MKCVEMRNFFITKRVDVGPRLHEASMKQRVTPTSSTQFFYCSDLKEMMEMVGTGNRVWR